jgi:hypothetical protein
MSTISTSNLQTIADNIAKSLVDIEAAYISGVTSTVTAVTNGASAASNSLAAHVAALADLAEEKALVLTASQAAANVSGQFPLTANQFYDLYRTFLFSLDQHTGGLNTYLTTNSVQVHPEFAAAFNRMAGLAVSTGLTGTAPTVIAPANIFTPTEVSLATISVTGSAAGTFAAGSTLDTTKYGGSQIYVKNTGGSGSTGTATSFTVTYTKASDGTTGHTATQALGGSLGAGAYLAIGSIADAKAVTAIAVNSGGANADTFAVVIKVLRAIAY